MEDVVAADRRIEKILAEETDSKMERLISSMQDQIRLLKKDLKEAHDQISAHQATATPTAALATTSAVTVAAAHPPPLTPAQPPPLATTQPPPPTPARHLYQGYPEESPYFQPQADRLPPRCFCVGKKGILCPTARPVQSSNACCANKRALTLAAHLEDKYWSYLQHRMMARNPLKYS